MKSSIVAWLDIQDKLSARRAKVFEVIKSVGNVTRAELRTKMDRPDNEVGPRIHELKELGLVVEADKRNCKITRREATPVRPATEFEYVEFNLRKQFYKTRFEKCAVCDGKGKIKVPVPIEAPKQEVGA